MRPLSSATIFDWRRCCLALAQYVMSPMPGSLVSLAVEVGSEVIQGAEIGVLEGASKCSAVKPVWLLSQRQGTRLAACCVGRHWHSTKVPSLTHSFVVCRRFAAMKMQNVIRAERSGVVKSVTAAVGDTLQADDIIIEFED